MNMPAVVVYTGTYHDSWKINYLIISNYKANNVVAKSYSLIDSKPGLIGFILCGKQ